ncbi:hypothetical protein IQ62_01500 [Streptomyces scabiei]|uniref:hypothetical protein n=1 Tax=Streptomyces scabiei TaxID=1930 RepID=UPI0004E65E59|nr:hypothetical protein [Streptomyces scabiei]KFG02523.1 hypothetical protein IQ62_01500 [Streptomyces scabiei]
MANRPPTAKDLRTKELLEAAAVDLRGRGQDEWAGAIDHVLSPAGWPMLARLHNASGTSSPGDNLAIHMSVDFAAHVKDAIQRAALEDPDEDVDTVTDAVAKGFEAFLSGEFVLAKGAGALPPRSAKTNLNVRDKLGLRGAVQDRLRDPEVVRELGEATVSTLARAYLEFRYPMPVREDDGPVRPASLPRGAQRNPEVPREVRERIREALRDREETVEDIVNEGLQGFLDGTFEPIPARWSDAERERLVPCRMHPDNDLWARVTAAVKGKGMRASHVAVAYLMDELGIEAGSH